MNHSNIFDSLEKIKKTIEKSSELIKYGGKLIIEIGDTQKNWTKQVLENNGFYVNKICKDLSNKDRCLVSTKIS